MRSVPSGRTTRQSQHGVRILYYTRGICTASGLLLAPKEVLVLLYMNMNDAGNEGFTLFDRLFRTTGTRTSSQSSRPSKSLNESEQNASPPRWDAFQLRRCTRRPPASSQEAARRGGGRGEAANTERKRHVLRTGCVLRSIQVPALLRIGISPSQATTCVFTEKMIVQ